MSNCEQCGKSLDKEKIRKGGQKRRPRFCSRECATESLKARQFFLSLSVAGNRAQAAYKAIHGQVPGYEQRVAVLRRPDRTNRRKKRIQ